MTGPGETIRHRRPIIMLVEGVVTKFQQWARGLRPSDGCDLAAIELIELLFLCVSWGHQVSMTGPGDTIRHRRPIILLIERVVVKLRRWARGLSTSDGCDSAAMELMLIEFLFLCSVCDNGEQTMQTQSDGTDLSYDVLTTSPSSLEDEDVGEGLHGRVVWSPGMQMLIY